MTFVVDGDGDLVRLVVVQQPLCAGGVVVVVVMMVGGRVGARRWCWSVCGGKAVTRVGGPGNLGVNLPRVGSCSSGWRRDRRPGESGGRRAAGAHFVALDGDRDPGSPRRLLGGPTMRADGTALVPVAVGIGVRLSVQRARSRADRPTRAPCFCRRRARARTHTLSDRQTRRRDGVGGTRD